MVIDQKPRSPICLFLRLMGTRIQIHKGACHEMRSSIPSVDGQMWCGPDVNAGG
jgi:hypothetical protein